jgi:uncharacterized iron-regulated protein
MKLLKRRDWLCRTLMVGSTTSALAACGSARRSGPSWARQLRGPKLALLGEVHDNAALQIERLRGLQAAVDAGWRPTVVMEQFDTDRQFAIDDVRRARPRDAAHLIAHASTRTEGGAQAWDWPLYRPLIELVLAHDLPLRAANLPRDQARRVVRGGWSAVFSPDQQQTLGLNSAVPAALQAAQEAEVDKGHCGALPASVLPGMARAQMARDAVMSDVLRQALRSRPDQGAVLIAGNGHVRRDLGVPQWLAGLPAQTLWVVGFVEALPAPGMYDEVVLGDPTERGDPCVAFKSVVPPPTSAR